MDGGRMERRNQVAIVALVVLLVAGALLLGPSLRAKVAGTSGEPAAGPQGLTLLGSGVRFRIVGVAPAQANPGAFTPTSYVVPNHRAAEITDVVLQNPHGDGGTLRILIGTEVILEEKLEGFGSQHYQIPLHVKAGQPVVVSVSCQIPGTPQPVDGSCAPSVSFFG